jgi:hypothetical protein
MAGSDRHVTTDHDEIRRWVEERGGRPAEVASTATSGAAGILRIDFPDYGDDSALEEISWEDFFDKFEEKNLAFIYQDHLKDGKPSRFSKFVARGSVQA